MKRWWLGRRILIGVLITVLIVGNCYYYAPMRTEAATAGVVVSASEINARIDELYALLGNKYFNIGQNTDCGSKTKKHSCDYCYTPNIVNQRWFINMFGNVKTSQFPKSYGNGTSYTSAGWSCLGFANFAEWYIFKNSTSDTVTTTKVGTYKFNQTNASTYARIGDELRLNNSHSVIFIDANASGIWVLDCNYGGNYNCRVSAHNISYGDYSTFTISRATNSEFNGSSGSTNTVTSYTLDVNPQIDHVTQHCGLDGYTFNVTVKDTAGNDVSGTYGANNVIDYCRDIPYGYTYAVTPVGNTTGHTVFRNSGTIEAKINEANPVWIRNNYKLDVNPMINGEDCGGGREGYTFDVIIKNQDGTDVSDTWGAKNVIDFYKDVPYGYFYTVTPVGNKTGYNTYGVTGKIGTQTNIAVPKWVATDTTPPVISNVQVSDYTGTGYTVTCTVTDNIAVDRVQFPTWTDANGQDDLASNFQTNTKVRGTKSGDTYTFTVKASDHNNEQGLYKTHIYAYDTVGNYICYKDEIQVTVATYNLYLDPNGGKFSNGSDVQRTASPKLIYKGEIWSDVSTNKPVREGYTFEGWYTAATGGTKIYGADGIACADGTYWTLDIKNKKYQYVYTGDLKVYAHWKADIVTISYDANGGTGAPQPQQKKPSERMQLSSDTPFRAGYFFDGWNTEADGSGKSYREGAEYTGNTDVTLYAQWVENASYSKSMNKVKVSKIAKQNYTGSAITPKLTVKLGKQKLQENVDYTVSYVNNVKTGKATAILTGIGEFIGTREVSFNIVGSSITKAKVTGITAKIYDGQEHKQNLTVKLKGNVLKENEDYEVTYSKNLKAGTATVKITGLNAFSGTIKKTFKIAAYNLAKDEARQIGGIPNNLTMAYTGGGCRPEFNLTFRGTELVKNKDYTVVYKNNKAVGSVADKKHPTVVIKGKGNFKGTINVAFNILPVSVADARMSAEITEEEITVTDPDQMPDQLQDQSQDEAVVPAEQEEYGTTDGCDGLAAEQVLGQEELLYTSDGTDVQK